MKKIKVITTYEHVDDEFLDWYTKNVLPARWEEFKRGEPVQYTSQDPENRTTTATTTWQVIEEELQ